MTLDADERLAFALAGGRGAYALLIGSGVSSAAGIPTGWTITLDLISRLAVVQGHGTPEDPENWYKGCFRKDPDYSDLIEMLASTSTERQRLINEYIEPNDEEKRDGRKQPTLAHHAIAKLADLGMVRVIVTTNFDRLIENALAEADVPHAVISSVDDIEGMTPLTQSFGQCQIIKLHGDYKDVRSLNTITELSQYPERNNRLLDQIFDEFGMIVCGWSADWDGALRAAVRRCKSQRFSWYWAHRGEVGESAEKLIQCRSAERVRIQDADSFFSMLQNRTEALLETRRPAPGSTELAVATLKRYVAGTGYQIQLERLIREQAEKAANIISNPGAAMHLLSVEQRAEIAEAACETLIAMGAVAGRWMAEQHRQDWLDALETLLYATSAWPQDANSYIDAYPSALVLWSLCTGAVAGGRYDTVKFLMDARYRTGRGGATAIVQGMHMFSVGIPPTIEGTELYPGKWGRTPGLHPRLLSSLTKAMEYVTYNNADRYRLNIDQFEMLWHFASAWRTIKENQKRPGSATQQLAEDYRNDRLRMNCNWDNRREIIREFKTLLADLGDEAPLVKSGLFGHSATEALESIEFVEDPDSTIRRWREMEADPNRY